jgi:hypothetical protein
MKWSNSSHGAWDVEKFKSLIFQKLVPIIGFSSENTSKYKHRKRKIKSRSVWIYRPFSGNKVANNETTNI